MAVAATLLAAGAPGVVGACGQTIPTEVVVQVYTDLPCPAIAAVAAGPAGELGNRAASATSTTCDPDSGSLGQLVIVPRGSENAELAVEVRVRTDHRDPDACLESEGYDGCIVSRRILNYIPGRTIHMRVDLRNPCVDTPCNQTTSCVAQGLGKACVTARVDPTQCEDVCTDEDLLQQHEGTFEPCDETSNPCGSGATCAVADSGATLCLCPAGYTLNDSRDCVDVDECTSDLHDCHAKAMCTNTAGGFECACLPNYTGDGRTCTSTCPTTCASTATCKTVSGERTCVCDDGYTGNGTSCSDVDECLLGTHDCVSPATCVNTAGSFECSCPDGYAPQGTNACSDVDECLLGTHDCSVEATCENTAGSYECVCPGDEVYNEGACYPANLALAAVASASSTYENGPPYYSPAHANDGSTNTTLAPENGWANAQFVTLPQWWQLTWEREVTFSAIELYSAESHANFSVRDYDLLYWDGTDWITIEEVRGNTSVHRTHSFAPVTTDQLRVLGHSGPSGNPQYIHLNEVEVYAE